MNEREEYNNLILNMSSGLLPENLTIGEILLLRKMDGNDWFHKLGYSEDKYKNPKIYKITGRSVRGYNPVTGEENLDWKWDSSDGDDFGYVIE